MLFRSNPLSPPTTSLTEKLVTLGSFAKAPPTKLETLIALSVIVRESWAGPTGRGWPSTFKFLPQTTSHMIKNIPFLSGLTLTTPPVFGLFA